MKIQSIAITNVKAIEALTFQPGTLTVISGDNETGKTSILDALRMVFEGGKNPSLIRNYGRPDAAKKAEVLITLDNGTTIRKMISEKTSLLEIKTADGSVVKSPQSYVESLAKSFAFDPLAFDTADPKKRLEFLYRACDLKFTRKEVSDAAEGVSVALPVLTLDELAAFRQGRYDERTKANVAAKQLEGTIHTLTGSLPDAEEKDWVQESAVSYKDLQRIKDVLSEAQKNLEWAAGTEKDAIRETHEQEAEAIRLEMQERLDAVSKRKAQALTQVDVDVIGKKAELQTEAGPKIEALSAQVATANEKATTQRKAEGVKQSIAEIDKQLREHRITSVKLDRVLENLDSLKKAKLDKLPIDGVDIRDGQIYVNGVVYDELNTAQRYLLCIQIGTLQLGELGFLVADDAEHLGRKNRESLEEALRGSGLQLVIAEVRSDEPLKINAA